MTNYGVYLKTCLDGDLLLVKKVFENLSKHEIELIRDENKANCIHYAARKGHIKVLEYLIFEKNVSPNLNSSVGATILHDAAATSRVETIEWILKNTNLKITIKDFDGAMVLHIASKYGQNRFIEWYFKYFDLQDAALKTNNGATCLHFACASGSYMCVKNIVAAAPETINIKTKNGLTPIYLAVQGNHLDIVKLLVNDYKASFIERDLDGMSLLHVACQNGCLDVLKWLIEIKGFNINDLDSKGTTGLHYSCYNGHPDLVFYLLYRNARIQVDDFGGTPLHDCAEMNQIECARLLLTSKCNVKTIDNHNLSAYEVAVKRGFHQLANEIKFVEEIYSSFESINCSDSLNLRASTKDSQPVNIIRSYAKTMENSKKYYSIKEEENVISDLDNILNEYDKMSLRNHSKKYSTGNNYREVDFIDYSNQNITIENLEDSSSLPKNSTNESIDLTNHSSYFPSPPSFTNLKNVKNDYSASESFENLRSGYSYPNIVIKISDEIKNDVEQDNSQNSKFLALDSFGEISSKNSVASRKGTKTETSFVDELKKIFVAASQQTSMIDENDNVSFCLNGNQTDCVRENAKPIIPLWKQQLLEEKSNQTNIKISNSKVISNVNSKPEWMNELESKK